MLQFVRGLIDNLDGLRTAAEIARNQRGGSLHAHQLRREFFDTGSGLTQRTLTGRAHCFQLVVNILLVPGQLVRDFDQLIEDHPGDAANARNGNDHYQRYRGNAAQTHFLQPVHGGCQDQRQCDRKDERNQDLASQIQQGDHGDQNRGGPYAR